MYLAKRILPADEGKHLKGLFGCGPTPMDVPVGAIWRRSVLLRSGPG